MYSRRHSHEKTTKNHPFCLILRNAGEIMLQLRNLSAPMFVLTRVISSFDKSVENCCVVGRESCWGPCMILWRVKRSATRTCLAWYQSKQGTRMTAYVFVWFLKCLIWTFQTWLSGIHRRSVYRPTFRFHREAAHGRSTHFGTVKIYRLHFYRPHHHHHPFCLTGKNKFKKWRSRTRHLLFPVRKIHDINILVAFEKETPLFWY